MNTKTLLKTRISTALALLATTALLLSACAGDSPANTADQAVQDSAILSEFQIEGPSTKELILYLDAIPVAERPEGLGTSIKADRIELANASGNTESIQLPENEFYLSFAPYLTKTHDCFFHNPTGCIGELANEPFQVEITDLENGDVLVSEEITSFDNGFIGVWLPRDIQAKLSVTHQDGAAETVIGTTDADPSCLTTLQLK